MSRRLRKKVAARHEQPDIEGAPDERLYELVLSGDVDGARLRSHVTSKQLDLQKKGGEYKCNHVQ